MAKSKHATSTVPASAQTELQHPVQQPKTPLDKGGKDGVTLWDGEPPVWGQPFTPQVGEIVVKAKIVLATLLKGGQFVKLTPYKGVHIETLDVNKGADAAGVKITRPDDKANLRDAILTVLHALREVKTKEAILRDVLRVVQGVDYTPNNDWFTKDGKPTPQWSEFEKRWNITYSGDTKAVAQSYGTDDFGNPRMTREAAYAAYNSGKRKGIVLVAPPDRRGKPKSTPSKEVLDMVAEFD